MSTFVSGIDKSRPGSDFPQHTSLPQAIKKLEVGVKGYATPRTDQVRAREAQRYPERDNAMDRYWPIRSKEEMLDERLANFTLTDTSKAEQIPLPF